LLFCAEIPLISAVYLIFISEIEIKALSIVICFEAAACQMNVGEQNMTSTRT